MASNANVSMDSPCFDNPKEEALYWKQMAHDYFQKLQDARDEFDEFQQGSQELEAELEVQLEQYEQRVSELVSAKEKLEEENHVIKEKLEVVERDSFVQISDLQDENLKIKTVSEEMQKYIRELEQCNDDLERSKRATICSLEEFDVRLNNAIERNAFLENELEEKERLIITVQRLKDESRDLKGELASTTGKGRKSSLNESKLRLEETQCNVLETNNTGECKKRTALSPKSTDANQLKKRDSTVNHSLLPNTPNQMSPSARISALNIVSDLLRKVGALESKLARCRNFVQDHPQGGTSSPHMLCGAPSIDDVSSPISNGSCKTSNNSLSGSIKANS